MFKKSPSIKNIIALSIDLTAASIVGMLGLYLRLGDEINIYGREFLIKQDLLIVLSALISSIIFNVYRDIWRYFNLDYLIRYFEYCTLTIFIFTLLLFFNSRLESFPRSVIFINWLLLIFITTAPRILYKVCLDTSLGTIFKKTNYLPSPILIIGVNRSIETFIDELRRLPNAPYKVIGILDRRQNIGRQLSGIPIIGDTKNFKKIIEDLIAKNKKPMRILVSSESHLSGFLQELIQVSKELSIPVSRLPRLTELSHNISGKSIALQPIAVEDLLKRAERKLDLVKIESMVKGKVIVITGAGGSIGSEIVRQCAIFGAKEIYLLDISEYLLYEIEQECKRSFPNIKITACLADIKDSKEINQIISMASPHIVFHAAALKHVPMLERHKIQAIGVNVFGTINIINASIKYKVPQLVFISTDKAVNPLSFMGATKRVAEMACQLNSSKKTIISIVRFGNVLGSNGSVVPLFEKQIQAGGPITVTDPETTRYFMTIPEAVGLVLQAAALNSGNNFCQTYVLDMGEPIKIYDLAEQMIVLAGLKVNVDIKIIFTGLRPGDKLHEILVTTQEKLEKTESNDIFLANPHRIKKVIFKNFINDLQEAFNIKDEKVCISIINELVNFKKLNGYID